nr:hypothetical protein GCM10020063_102910 [Dactylosporangium thailandense]
MSNTNTYLDQVVRQQERLESDLRSKRAKVAPSAPAPAGGPQPQQERGRGGDGGRRPTPNAVEVRVTGFGRWKTVLVPPNAFVVHTRRGRPEPLHVGLGVSFRYNPATDSYLVVPGAMQTILINAYCICRELQGVLVQAYVQWIIQDFSTAYRRLDFGDPEDPMRLVNLQLKEQAEAAIKDKVSTLGVAEVLSDKQPIIEELTARLRAVAEGSGSADAGLGLRIVTVQIKEAVVSSSRLWENLQQPYRTEQGRIARLAELAAEEAVAERELAAQRQREAARIASDRELADLRAQSASHEFDREASELLRRSQREQQDARALAELRDATNRHALALERQLAAEEAEIGRLRIAREAELTRLAAEAELALAATRAVNAHEEALLDVERERLRAEIANAQSPENLQAQLIERLPEIVARLPKPAELRSVTIGGNDGTSVAGLIAELTAVVGALQQRRIATE